MSDAKAKGKGKGKKRERVDEPPSPGSSDEENQKEIEDEVIDAEFGLFDPKPEDWHAVKNFLSKRVLDDKPFDSSDLADRIVEQVTVGSMIRVNDEDCYGFATVLNWKQHQDSNPFKQLLEFITSNAGDKASEIQRVFDTIAHNNIGLWISERIVNVPPILSLPLVQAVVDDLAWAVENEDTKELRDSFKLTHYIYLTKAYTLEEESSEQQVKTKKAKKSKKKVPSLRSLTFFKVEDEFLAQAQQEDLQKLTFETPMNQYHVCLVMKHKALLKAIEVLQEALAE